MALELRPASREDVPAILELVKALAAYEKCPEAVLATEDVLRENIFDREHAHVVLALADGQAVGMAVYVSAPGHPGPGPRLPRLLRLTDCRPAVLELFDVDRLSGTLSRRLVCKRHTQGTRTGESAVWVSGKGREGEWMSTPRLCRAQGALTANPYNNILTALEHSGTNRL
jgi:hypothetical protein